MSAVPSNTSACLVADVGGTNARLGWTHDGYGVRDVVVHRCRDHASLAHILGAYRRRMEADHPGLTVDDAVVAIAGYLQGDRLVNSNLPWEVSVARTADDAGLVSLTLINDFGAVAHAVPDVQRHALVPLLPGQTDGGMQVPALVLGPGTGLGAALCLDRTGSDVLLTESGHAALAANNALEVEVVQGLARRWQHVDNERVLSGTGIMHLYGSLAAMRGKTARHQQAEQVVGAVLAGDVLARETIDVFCGWLGSLVADLMLTLGAKEAYLAGGVTTHIAPFLEEGLFQHRYSEKFTARCAPPPVWRIEHGRLGLAGAAIHWRMHRRRRGHFHEEHA